MSVRPGRGLGVGLSAGSLVAVLALLPSASAAPVTDPASEVAAPPPAVASGPDRTSAGAPTRGRTAAVPPETAEPGPVDLDLFDVDLSGVDASGGPLTDVAVPVGATSPLAASGIPTTALEAYQQAADGADCGIDWSLIAAIGRVESNHGRFAGAVLHTDGLSSPPIVGIPLTGNGTARILDTDGGLFDRDTEHDRAVGPMQFIPSTWAVYGADGNGDGIADPFNIFDAAVGAADYLCAAGKDLSTTAGQARAVFAYNHSDAYVASVLGLAATYAGTTPPELPTPAPVEGPEVPPVDPAGPPALDPPLLAVVEPPVVLAPPVVIEPPVVAPPVVETPVVVEPPVVDPPVIEPPVVDPPVVQPPVEEPPVDGPPVEEPPVGEPPVVEPPVVEPPVVEPPVDQPPVDQPPVDQPPVDGPPVEEPPVDGPPVEEPPVDGPPVEEPPVVTPEPAPEPEPEPEVCPGDGAPEVVDVVAAGGDPAAADEVAARLTAAGLTVGAVTVVESAVSGIEYPGGEQPQGQWLADALGAGDLLRVGQVPHVTVVLGADDATLVAATAALPACD